MKPSSAILTSLSHRRPVLVSVEKRNPWRGKLENQRPREGKIKGAAPRQHKPLTRLTFAGADRSGLAPEMRIYRFISMKIMALACAFPRGSMIHARG